MKCHLPLRQTTATAEQLAREGQVADDPRRVIHDPVPLRHRVGLGDARDLFAQEIQAIGKAV